MELHNEIRCQRHKDLRMAVLEAVVILNAHGHGEIEDPECPSCWARRKLREALIADREGDSLKRRSL